MKIIEKDINLLPQKEKLNYKKLYIVAVSFLSFLTIGLLALFFYILPQFEINELIAKNESIKNRLAQSGEVNERLKKYKEKQSEFQNQKDIMDAINSEKFSVIEFLDRIKKSLPENIFISSLSINNENLNISFISSNPIDTARLIVKIKEMNIFEDVEISNIPIESKENLIECTLKIKGSSSSSNSSPETKEEGTAASGDTESE